MLHATWGRFQSDSILRIEIWEWVRKVPEKNAVTMYSVYFIFVCFFCESERCLKKYFFYHGCLEVNSSQTSSDELFWCHSRWEIVFYFYCVPLDNFSVSAIKLNVCMKIKTSFEVQMWSWLDWTFEVNEPHVTFNQWRTRFYDKWPITSLEKKQYFILLRRMP